MLMTEQKVKDRDPLLNRDEVPESIVERLKSIYAHCEERAPNGTPYPPVHTSAGKPETIIVPYYDDEAKCMHDSFMSLIEVKREESSEASALMVRTAEMAVRIATIIAIGRNPNAAITTADLSIGHAVAMWSAETMIEGAGLYMSVNENQANAQAVLRIIREKGGSISHRDLSRAIGHKIKVRDLKDILQSLEAAGQIKIPKPFSPSTGGHPIQWYLLVK